jgi:hypothetical protein
LRLQVARAIAMNVGMMATYDVSKSALVSFNGDNFSTQVRHPARMRSARPRLFVCVRRRAQRI